MSHDQRRITRTETDREISIDAIEAHMARLSKTDQGSSPAANVDGQDHAPLAKLLGLIGLVVVAMLCVGAIFAYLRYSG